MKKQVTDIKLKREIVLKAIEIGISKVSKDYYISRVTITKWVKRYKKFGIKGLEDIIKRKSLHPNRMSDTDIKRIQEVKKKHTDWSARKIRDHLKLNYSLQTVSKKIKTYLENNMTINEEIKNSNSLYHLELTTTLLSSNKSNHPTHQFELLDIKSGFIFLGFSCEKSNLSFSIFMDYIFRSFKDNNVDLKKITLYTKRTRSSFSFSDNKISLFEYIVKEKYGVNLSYNLDSIKNKSRKRKVPKFENFNSEKEYLFQGFSYIIYNNIFSSLFKFTPIEQLQKDHKFKNVNNFNLPPIIVDNHLNNLPNIKLLEDYWYITDKEKKLFLKKTIQHYKRNTDKIKDFDYKKTSVNYQIIENLLKSEGDNKILLNSIEERANLLVQTGKWSEAETLFTEALEIAQKLDDNKYLTRLYRYLAQRFFHKGDYEIAFSYITKSRLLAAKSKYKNFLPQINITTGLILTEIGKEDEAMSYYKKVVTYAKRHKDNYLETIATINIALIYYYNKNFEKSTDIFISIIEKAKEIEDKNYLAAIYGNLGSIFSQLQEFSRSMSYNLRTLKLIRQSKNRHYIAILFGNFANIYQNLGDYKRAQKLYKKELNTMVQLGDQKNTALVLYNIGHCYLYSSKLKQSLEYLQKSSKIYKKLGLDSNLFNNHLTMANVYQKKNDLFKAKSHLIEAEKIGKDNLTFEDRFNLLNIKDQIEIDKIIVRKGNPKKIIPLFSDIVTRLLELKKSNLNIRLKLDKKSEIYYMFFSYLQKVNKIFNSENEGVKKLNHSYRISFYAKKLILIYDKLNRNSENFILNERVKEISKYFR